MSLGNPPALWKKLRKHLLAKNRLEKPKFPRHTFAVVNKKILHNDVKSMARYESSAKGNRKPFTPTLPH